MMWLLSGFVCTAEAQVIDVAEGSIRPLFGGNESSPQTFSFTFDAEWGYDNNESPTPDLPVEETPVVQSGYATTVLGALRYQRGRPSRNVSAVGSTSVNYQQIGTVAGVNRIFRGDVTVQGVTGIGQRAGITGDASIAYVPATLFGALDSLEEIPGDMPDPDPPVIPPSDATRAVTSQEWLSTQAAGSAYFRWTPRQRMDVRYEATRSQPITGLGLESRSQAASVLHAWNPSPNRGLDFAYRFEDSPQVFENRFELPLQSHTVEGRVRYGRSLSPNTRWSVLAGGGVNRTLTRGQASDADLRFWAPIGSANLRWDFNRNWGASVGARRDVSVLGGLSPEPFASTAASAGLDGVLARRTTISASVDYSQGTSQVNETGDFRMVMGHLQVRYGLNPRLGLLFRYTYSEHRLTDISVVPLSFPNRFSSSSFRVGVTTWLPLYGAF